MVADREFETVCGCHVRTKTGFQDKIDVCRVTPTCATCLTTHLGGKATSIDYQTLKEEVEATLRDAVKTGNADFYPALVRLRMSYDAEHPMHQTSSSHRWCSAVRQAVTNMGCKSEFAEIILQKCRAGMVQEKSRLRLHTASNA